MTFIDAFLEFVLDPLYLRILQLTVLLFVVAFVIWYMYISLSKRDLIKITHPKDMKNPNFWDKFAYLVKYVLFFPVLTFLWFVLFVACLKILSAKQNLEEIMLLGIIIVSAVRIAAHVNSKMAEDMAKLLPLTLLAGIILNPSFITLNANIQDSFIFLAKLPEFGKYLLFIIALELVLKVGRGIYLQMFKKEDEAKTA